MEGDGLIRSLMDRDGQRQTETDQDGPKQIEMDQDGVRRTRRTEMDRLFHQVYCGRENLHIEERLDANLSALL